MKKFLSVLIFLNAFLLHAQTTDLVQYAKPIIGTGKMGHTFPGATVPFGAVQLSPDTDTIPYAVNGKYNGEVYRYCAGYQYNDPTIVGFSHTHFSGTGHSDLGDLLIMPSTGPLQLNPGTRDHPETGYRSAYSHSTEVAEPGYYKVRLDDNNITAELTATTRVGFHQYTFPATDSANIIFDLVHGIYNYDEKDVWTIVRVENDSTVTGYRQTTGWARNRTVYFAMRFSKPFRNYGAKDYSAKVPYRGFWGKFDQSKNFPDLAGRKLRMYFSFSMQQGEKLGIKVALSPVSTSNAIMNMQAEAPDWNFDKVRMQARQAWQNQFDRIQVKMNTTEELVNFYTAMYHAFLSPTIYMDVDSTYKGLDQNVHKATNFTNYTTFSLWDTYRALHPFFNLLAPSRNSDMVSSMLAHYDQSALHMLPVWSHYANDNWCMSGYHSVSVVADAIIKGTYPGDANHALEACVATAGHNAYEGIGEYANSGYIPAEKNGTSVSSTLEYAYDDWCIAQLAQKLNRTDIYNRFIKRSANWKNVYDSSIGFMRPRLANGMFKKDFDVLQTDGQGFIEGNAWNYSLYVPHDPQGLVQIMGGSKKFIPHLDSLFTMHLPDAFFEHTEDITREGIIGNYVHGNEPAHHVAYLYNYTSQPWKTQERVRMILNRQYHNGAEGLGGNDDCGQMSAWYIFSALGFYPVAPAAPSYAIGSPAVSDAVIHFENGKTLHIMAKDQSDKNVYVKKILLNGQVISTPFITHSQLLQGGELIFYMSALHGR